MSKTQVETINALSELERLGWKYKPKGDYEVSCLCPVHDDNTPSVSLNTKKNVWRCHVCKAKGDIITLLVHILNRDGKGITRQAVILDLSSRYDLEDIKCISPEIVERMHSKIWDSGPLLTALKDRGFTDDMVRRFRIGYHEGRITIPIYDKGKRVVNIRRYLPGAPSSEKVQNTKGYGQIRLFNVDDLKHDKIWICGGELKAALVSSKLKSKRVGAVSATAGEGNWDGKWGPLFKGKQVWVCMDIDTAGKDASRKVAEYIAPFSKQVRIINLPLDATKYPHGDVNDYVGQEGARAAQLLRLMVDAKPFEPGSPRTDSDKGLRSTTLAKVTHPSNVGWRLEFEAMASAIDTTPYLVPRKINVSCTRDQPKCHICPIAREEKDEAGHVEQTISSTSSGILDMVSTDRTKLSNAIRESLFIPKCKVVEFDVKEHFTVMDARLSPQLEISADDQTASNLEQPAFCVTSHLDLNTPYLFRGRIYPHPKSQQAALVLDDIEETTDSLTSFHPGKTELTALEIFSPEEWSLPSLQKKLDEIYFDLESNVTRIFQRRDLHLAIDLTYHSCLRFKLGQKVVPGWVNILILGDSSQGKTETTQTLRAFYGLGERVECKNATVAGLLGGVQQLGGRWFHSWGIVPTHDKRLVILEEVKGASTEVLAKLTDMRSSGIAEIPKISHARAHARTRLIFISNARSARPLSAFSFGIEAIQELIGSLEDVRRFDLCMLVAAGQVDIDSMELISTNSDHVFTSSLCRRLILWSWTRTVDQVQFEEDALQALKNFASSLTADFTETIPLVDRGTIKQKLARLSVALAARTYSHDKDNVIVRRCHVEYIVEMLRRLYCDPVFGYDTFSTAQRSLETIDRPHRVEAFLVHETKHPLDTVRGLLHTDEITETDIQDLCDIDRETARSVISFLVRHHALRRNSRWSYGKTTDFIELLRTLPNRIQEIEQEESEL